jgi:hypothetical protein
MAAPFRCGTSLRRRKVRDAQPPTINGIDYLEVSVDQLTLQVFFLFNLPGGGGADPVPDDPNAVLSVEKVVIEGGVRFPNIQVLAVSAADNVLTVTVNAPGDFSTYTLRLRASAIDEAPPAHFDAQLSEVQFSFKAGCASDFDCKITQVCPPEVLPEPEIDYLAKDYASFRRLMLDRMAVLLPDWAERNPADGHVALVELLAYYADYLSYFQDAIATEAYLGTARRLISARRHARLLDYRVHYGCNARAWIGFTVDATADGQTIDAKTPLLSRGATSEATVHPNDLDNVLAVEQPVVFEAMTSLTLWSTRNSISFYTWSDEECCLPAGSTRATLKNDPATDVAVGDLLLFEEIRSPTTGLDADADPDHRHVVRLTSVSNGVDEVESPPVPVTEISWADEDALPFPLCISARIAGGPQLHEISVARGNVLLADHGRTLEPEAPLPETVPGDRPYRPVLKQGPLTFYGPFDPEGSAAAAMEWDVRSAVPKLSVSGDDLVWEPVFDLLGSDRFDPKLVVEVEPERPTQLRFGDGKEHGRRPTESTKFSVSYRIGNGAAGLVGAEAITRAVVAFSGIETVRNPLPAVGGTEPESLGQVKIDAPEAFRVPERAVTEADYTEVVTRRKDVENAVANFRWTGSWYTAFVTVDRLGGQGLDNDFRRDLLRFLDRYRMAGQDLELELPVMVPLDIRLNVCVLPRYRRSDVEQALLDIFSSRQLPDGRRGFFHPDNFTFGQPVYLSQIYATAMAVDGLSWVQADRFQRWGKLPNQELQKQVLQPGPMEVVRLDNDPNFRENGRLELVLAGGL